MSTSQKNDESVGDAEAEPPRSPGVRVIFVERPMTRPAPRRAPARDTESTRPREWPVRHPMGPPRDADVGVAAPQGWDPPSDDWPEPDPPPTPDPAEARPEPDAPVTVKASPVGQTELFDRIAERAEIIELD